MTTPLKRKGSKHASPEVRQAQLLEAGLRCFGKNGFYASTMDQIVEASGLSKGSLYRFFPSKDDLLLAIVDSLFAQCRTTLAELEQNLPPMEALKQYCLYNIQTFARDPDVICVWLQFSHHPEAKRRIRNLYQADRKDFARILRQAGKNGDIDLESANTSADTLLALLEGHLAIAAVEHAKRIEQRFTAGWNMFASAHGYRS